MSQIDDISEEMDRGGVCDVREVQAIHGLEQSAT